MADRLSKQTKWSLNPPDNRNNLTPGHSVGYFARSTELGADAKRFDAANDGYSSPRGKVAPRGLETLRQLNKQRAADDRSDWSTEREPPGHTLCFQLSRTEDRENW